MKLILDGNKIVQYVSVGGLDGATDFDGLAPKGFEDNFVPNYYMVENNQIVVNPDYQKPIVKEVPSDEQQTITTLASQVSQIQQAVTLLAQGGK